MSAEELHGTSFAHGRRACLARDFDGIAEKSTLVSFHGAVAQPHSLDTPCVDHTSVVHGMICHLFFALLGIFAMFSFKWDYAVDADS